MHQPHAEITSQCTSFISSDLPDVWAHGPDELCENWELWTLHINRVNALATAFAQPFEAETFLQSLAMWHDLGKLSDAWQQYLRRSVEARDDSDADAIGKVDHSSFGAQYAKEMLPGPLGRIAAYCIAGHHGGLLNSGSKTIEDQPGTLAHRLAKDVHPVAITLPELQVRPTIPRPALTFKQTQADIAFAVAFWGRMMFSCLVDADFLATEQHYNTNQHEQRSTTEPTWACWAKRVDECVAGKRNLTTTVGRCRDAVYQQCLQAAKLKPGFFSLTVPTGGGKTLASLAFATSHAHQQHLRRVIYALPFTSIIEQNVQVIRDVLEDADVLEHHSNLDPTKPENQTTWSRLAAENWDAPVVVTTNVQFFESLFANKTSRCRKLHRIAHSVIVLDEAQAIPVDLLKPCLAALDELVRNYGCTIVLCTATQPAVHQRADFAIGLENVHEIIQEPQQLFEQMKRVRVQFIDRQTQEQLAQRITQHKQVLTIVDTRQRAADLYRAIRHLDGVYHLSAAMCPANRSVCLDKIKECLKQSHIDDTPCHVVSTQLIEAGVDVDFPVVYRSLAGLDSIAQAAGRCNREGKRAQGEVYVFEPENGIDGIPKGSMRQAAECTREIMPDHVEDLLSLAAVGQYFQLHYWKRQDQWDKHAVMECFKEPQHLLFNYADAARRFEFIQQTQKPVVVSYGKMGHELISQLHREKPNREIYRLAQRYTVQIPIWHWEALLQAGEIELVNDQLAVLSNSARYDNELGLCLGDVTVMGESSVI
jgi:CRISPR-associated endonuclease/helicase Cas3